MFIPVAGPFAAAGFGAVGAVLSIRGIRLGKVVRDPPRDDFRHETEPVVSRLDLDPLRESPLGEPVIVLVAAVDETNRLLDAMVTAVERASGAEIAGDREAAEARLSEAYRFAEALSVGFRTSSAGAGQLAEAMMPYQDVRVPNDTPLRRMVRQVRRQLSRSTLASELPSDILQALEQMGFTRDELQIPLHVAEDAFPIRRLVSDLEDLAEVDSLYGRYLADAASAAQAFEQEQVYEDAGAE